MAYDRHGNYDYEASALEQQLRPHPAQRVGAGLRAGLGCARVAVIAIAVALVVGGLCGAVYYAAGRAVGAGLRDARRP